MLRPSSSSIFICCVYHMIHHTDFIVATLQVTHLLWRYRLIIPGFGRWDCANRCNCFRVDLCSSFVLFSSCGLGGKVSTLTVFQRKIWNLCPWHLHHIIINCMPCESIYIVRSFAGLHEHNKIVFWRGSRSACEGTLPVPMLLHQ